ILVIPCINTYGMNIGKRFCTTDNVDINRMFSETEYVGTSRKIAEGIFENYLYTMSVTQKSLLYSLFSPQ
ncbi:Succinylglutamate desuccinylase/aspartoacylase, partial [human gut metagenome]